MKLKYLFIALILVWSNAAAQSVYEPVSSDVYELLERFFIKGAIEYHSEIKPIPRKEIAGYLLEALENKQKLTPLDLKEIEFYQKEYADEFSFLSDEFSLELPRTEFFTPGETERFRLFNYRDSLFSFNLDPILGVEFAGKWNTGYAHTWNGVEFFGYISDEWGFSLDFRDNQEQSVSVDEEKNNTPEPGINISKSAEKCIQYSEVIA